MIKNNYKRIEITNFRRFKNLVIDDLSNINIFFGSNNSGKTTILEAVFAHASGLNFGVFFNGILPRRQGGTFVGPYDFGENILTLFHNYYCSPGELKFSIKSEYYNGEKNSTDFEFYHSTFLDYFFGGQIEDYNVYDRTLEAEKNSTNNVFLGTMKVVANEKEKVFNITFPGGFESASYIKLAVYHDILNHRDPVNDVKLYGALKRFSKIEKFVKELGEVFPYVKNIDNIPLPDSSPKIYVDTKDGKIPISVFGDGFRRFYYLIGNMVMYQNAVHLIEEVDATFHPKSIPVLARLLDKYCIKYKNQLFMTSHNQEFLEIFLTALEKETEILENNIRVFTLKDYNGELKLLKLNGFEALKNIKEYNLELR